MRTIVTLLTILLLMPVYAQRSEKQGWQVKNYKEYKEAKELLGRLNVNDIYLTYIRRYDVEFLFHNSIYWTLPLPLRKGGE